MKGTDYAPGATLWVCGACGKRSQTRFGFDALRMTRGTLLEAWLHTIEELMQ